MLAILSFIQIEKASETPVYQQIANGILQGIRSGNLRRGFKLPGTRPLSLALKVHRKTVHKALDELMAQGWLETVPRSGTFIAANLPKLKPIEISTFQTATNYPNKTLFDIPTSKMLNFPQSDYQHGQKLIISEGFPDLRLSPLAEFMKELRSLEKSGAFRKYFNYGNPQGVLPLRETLATFLSDTRGLPIAPQNILITQGAQMGLYIAANLLLKPKDHVIVGDPGYVTATLTLQRTGAIIHRVPVDESGIDVDAIETICRQKKIRAVYVIPHHHQPTTVSLIPKRRIRLLNLAVQYNFAILEDDYDYDFHYNSTPLLPMASLDRHGQVIYIGTLSKTIAPAVRLGFLVAPQNFIEEATSLRRSINFQGDSLTEITMNQLFKTGVIGNHIKKVVKIYKARRDNFCTLLQSELGEHVSFKVPDGGMAVWVKFPNHDLTTVAEKAAALGVFMVDGKIYNTPKINHQASRLGFTALSEQEMTVAVGILKKAMLLG